MTVLSIKNCINKLSIKMFIKRKTRADDLYVPNASEFSDVSNFQLFV